VEEAGHGEGLREDGVGLLELDMIIPYRARKTNRNLRLQ